MVARLLAGLVALSTTLGVGAADFRPILKGGFDLGGDTMVSVVFTNGETSTIKANEGFYLGGGLAVIDDARNLEYHLTLAYKIAVMSAENGDLEFTRVPLEALVFYRFPKVRVGGGLTYHLNPELEGSGVASAVDVKFKNALGFVLQADYLIWRGLAAGVRYTFLEYEAKGDATGTAKSNGLGLTVSYTF